ncbi:hypothetical protein ACTOB_000595 [Actinoplanes oblitus]|jgi:hypothetical protein|uniref:ABC transporter substrate-binding protein n=1 Tax=Actinoplanes oblitus TaxID=3040509 RepID=A0ABY8WGT5_9ACTN|nr:hypothetical protein [Actinoplanes oblitus]WIM97101.1 hypothetical protein ACTOB_000595 [Actinoplanes oblitus]
MSSRKLGRLAGLVFVLVAAFGGVGAVSVAEQSSSDSVAVVFSTLDAVWT